MLHVPPSLGAQTDHLSSFWTYDQVPLFAVKAHSTRPLSVSWAFKHRETIPDICKAVTWSSFQGFSKFYQVDVKPHLVPASVCRVAHPSARLLLDIQNLKNFWCPSVEEKENRIIVLFVKSFSWSLSRSTLLLFMIMLSALLCYETEAW